MPEYLENFPNALVSGKFPKCLGFLEILQISSHLRNFQNLRNIPPSNTYRNFGEFYKCLGTSEVLSNSRVSGKFPKCLGFWEIPQISSHLRNFQNLKNIPPSNTYKTMGNIPNTYRYLRVVYY